MTRGTTPIQIFKLPFFADEITTLRITYKQGDNVVLEKTEADVEKVDRTLRYMLSQEESLKFDPKYSAFVQLRCKKRDGSVHATNPKKISVFDVFNEEVLE